MGRVGVYIGLGYVNVTLDAMPVYYNGVSIVSPLTCQFLIDEQI